ncbi:hypothetical protein Efla_001221 [Eimeria flavescens]
MLLLGSGGRGGGARALFAAATAAATAAAAAATSTRFPVVWKQQCWRRRAKGRRCCCCCQSVCRGGGRAPVCLLGAPLTGGPPAGSSGAAVCVCFSCVLSKTALKGFLSGWQGHAEQVKTKKSSLTSSVSKPHGGASAAAAECRFVRCCVCVRSISFVFLVILPLLLFFCLSSPHHPPTYTLAFATPAAADGRLLSAAPAEGAERRLSPFDSNEDSNCLLLLPRSHGHFLRGTADCLLHAGAPTQQQTASSPAAAEDSFLLLPSQLRGPPGTSSSSTSSSISSSSRSGRMEVDGVDASVPSWVSAELQRPRKPFAEALQAERLRCPSAAAALDAMESLHARKLYHELTDAFAAYLDADAACDSSASSSVGSPPLAGGGPPPEALTPEGKFTFLCGVVLGLQQHLDSIRFLKICSSVLADIPPRGALLFLKKLEEETRPPAAAEGAPRGAPGGAGLGMLGAQRAGGLGSDAVGPNAFLLSLKALHSALAGDLEEAEETLEEAEKKTEKAMGLDPVVRAAWRKAAAELARARNKHGEFYKQTLIFLAYTSAASLKEKERIKIAQDISIAALIAPEVFNFGELLQQSVVLSGLNDGGERQWLFDLLHAFNKGSLDEYEEIMKKNEAKIMQTQLAAHRQQLRLKASTSALLRLAITSSAAGVENQGLTVQRKSSGGSCVLSGDASRCLTFAAISQSCRLGEDEVERLLMGAMARNLLKGKIDQLAKTVHLQWVRPALLVDRQSLCILEDRLYRWAGAADELYKTLQLQTTELLGS